MTYKGFEILLERQTCEFFTLNESGDVDQYEYDCSDSTHDGFHEYVAFDSGTGKRFIGAEDIESLKAYIDRALAEAEQEVTA